MTDLPSLLWAANLATIELHPLLGLAGRPAVPTAVMFDLDPGPPADVVDCCRVALWIRDELARWGLAAVVKTSGSAGLHVVVPLNGPHSYEQTKRFARTLAQALAARPTAAVATMSRAARAGRVLIDWSQNEATRSTVAPYSLRGMAWPVVSTPVTWEEIEGAAASAQAELLTFEPTDLLERLGRRGDLFGAVLDLAQTLPER